MSKISRVECLFCNHHNPASAKYCNECASPLQLQPCNACRAIDNRAAIACYKCGAHFNVPAAPKRAPARMAPKRSRAPAARKPAPAPAAPVPGFAAVPPILEDQVAQPIQNGGRFAIERAFSSESPVGVVGNLHREVTETQDQATSVADRNPYLSLDPAHPTAEPQLLDKAAAPESFQYPVLAHFSVEPHPIDEPVDSDAAVTAPGWRRARRLALLTLLLATVASGYYHYDRSAQPFAQGQSARQPAPSTPDGSVSTSATTETVATQVDAASAPKDPTSQRSTGAEEVEKTPSPAARVVAKPRTEPEPLAANRQLNEPASVSRLPTMPQRAGVAVSVRPAPVIDADVKTPRDPPIFKECTEAVAALGLCSLIKP